MSFGLRPVASIPIVAAQATLVQTRHGMPSQLLVASSSALLGLTRPSKFMTQVGPRSPPREVGRSLSTMERRWHASRATCARQPAESVSQRKNTKYRSQPKVAGRRTCPDWPQSVWSCRLHRRYRTAALNRMPEIACTPVRRESTSRCSRHRHASR